ncbi:MAG: OsmC family protein [Chlamydiota bacterium]
MTQIKIRYLGDLRTQCTHESGAQIQTDAPKDNHGKGEAFSPTDLFAASLGSCILTIMGIAARKLGVDLKGATAEVEKEMGTHPCRRVAKLIVRIRSALSPDAQVREKLEKAGLECPVHHSLHPDIQLEIDFVWGL